MTRCPGEQKRHFSEKSNVTPESIRRTADNDKDSFRDLIEHNQELLCEHDLEGRFLSVCPASARLLGYSVEEMMRIPMRELVAPRFRNLFDNYLREILRKGESRGLLAVLTRSGGERIWEYHNRLHQENVDRSFVRGVAYDVTDRILLEKALRASNEIVISAVRDRERLLQGLTLFRTLLDHSTDAILVVDPTTLHFLDVNETACRQLGYTREELLSMTVFDIAPSLDEKASAGVDRQLRDQGFATIVSVQQRKDKTTFPVEVNLRRVLLDREYNVVVSRDITARKQAEKRLREFERVVENLEEMIVVVNREYRYVLANRAYLNYHCLSEEAVVGRLVADVLGAEDFETVFKGVLDECFRGKTVTHDVTHVYPTMGERQLSITYLPVEGAAGIDRVACVVRDITEQKQADEALRESEARARKRADELQAVLDAVPVPVYMSRDVSCSRITGNRAAYEHTGMPAGTNFSASVPVGTQSAFELPRREVNVAMDLLPMRQAAATGKRVYERPMTMVFRDGSKRETVVNAVPLLDEGGKTIGVVGAAIDLTELKRVENALRESELRFRAVYERSPVGITLVDPRTGQFLQANPKFCEITGRSEEELLKIDLKQITHPDDVERSYEFLHQLAEGKLAHYEIDKRYLRPDGTARWVRVHGTRMWEQGASSLTRLALVEDITERKRGEQSLQEAQTELAHISRVVAMGELVASIAHEVNQPLSAVVMNSNFVLRELGSTAPDLEELRKAVAEVVEDATRISTVISRLRGMLAKGTSDRIELSINEMIHEATVLMRNEASGNDVQVRLELAPRLPFVLGDRVQLQQVLINLIINGIDAMRMVTDRRRNLDIRSAQHADGILVQVQDSGSGLDPDRIGKIFQPFFTTKAQGIGIGLSISRSIIESHGGHLWAEGGSCGALFQFTLPASGAVRNE